MFFTGSSIIISKLIKFGNIHFKLWLTVLTIHLTLTNMNLFLNVCTQKRKEKKIWEPYTGIPGNFYFKWK